jgi:bacteriocin biosynthesis cyclodehydratase domain-containing protein
MIELDDADCPWIRPEYEVLPLDGSAVLIRSPDRGVRAAVDGLGAATLAECIRELDGSRTVATWRRQEVAEGLDRLLRELIARDIVRSEPAPASTVTGDGDADLRLFAHYHRDPERCRRRLRASRVVVCGSAPALAACVQSDLRSAGVERIDALALPREMNAPIRAVDPALVARELRGVDLAIVCVSSPRDAWAVAMNAVALADGHAWLPLLQWGASALVGPLFVPDGGPCQECVWGRERANWADPDLTQRYVDGLAHDSESLRRYGSLPAFDALVSQWAVLEATKYLSRFTVPLLLGAVLRIDFLRAATEVHRVLQLPRCPRCSAAARAPHVDGRLFAPVS